MGTSGHAWNGEGLGSWRTHQLAAERGKANGRGFGEAITYASNGFRRNDGRSNAGHLSDAAKHATTRARAGGFRRIMLLARARRTGRADLSVIASLRANGSNLLLLLCTTVRAGRSRRVLWGDAFGEGARGIATAATGQQQRRVRDCGSVGDEKRRQRDPGNQS
jgi:hypothetical protein